MPYIKKEDRELLVDPRGQYHGAPIRTAGELNFVMTTEILKGNWKNHEDLLSRLRAMVAAYYGGSEKRYQNHNDVMGACVGASLELQRRFRQLMDKTSNPISTGMVALAFLLEEFYYNETGPYEDSKIKENGDVL